MQPSIWGYEGKGFSTFLLVNHNVQTDDLLCWSSLGSVIDLREFSYTQCAVVVWWCQIRLIFIWLPTEQVDVLV